MSTSEETKFRKVTKAVFISNKMSEAEAVFIYLKKVLGSNLEFVMEICLANLLTAHLELLMEFDLEQR